jgi:hypothetical protein
VSSRRRAVVTLGPLLLLAAVSAAACASIAELDVQYPPDATSEPDGAALDGPRTVRESSTTVPEAGTIKLEPSPLTPCKGDEAGLVEDGGEFDGGCDPSAGLGCCIKTAGESACLQQWEAPVACKESVFVTCRRSDGDSACCWRPNPNGKGRTAVFAAECEAGVACVDDADCPAEGPLAGCHTKKCSSVDFPIGECGSDPKCPEDL